jgi:hypothetical protein
MEQLDRIENPATIPERRAELKEHLYFKEVIQDLFRVFKNSVIIGTASFSPEMMWRKHHIDITFNHLRGYRNDFQKNWDIFTPEEQAILQNFIDRSLEYENEWKVNHDYSMRCPLFLDMDKVLQEVGGLME